MYSRHDWLRMTAELNNLLKEVEKYQDWYYYNRESETLFYHWTKLGVWLDYAHAFLSTALEENKWRKM